MNSLTVSRRLIAALRSLAIAAVICGLISPAQAGVLCELKSCLLAHDINGVQLDMTFRQVAVLFPTGLHAFGTQNFQAEANGVKYDLGFTPLGHLYRIDSNQVLGWFQPGREFGLNLTQRLTAKYGTPTSNQLPGGPAFWDFDGYYETNTGTRLARETEQLSAMLQGGYGVPISLIMKLMDFRILARDLTILNSGPESKAQSKIHF